MYDLSDWRYVLRSIYFCCDSSLEPYKLYEDDFKLSSRYMTVAMQSKTLIPISPNLFSPAVTEILAFCTMLHALDVPDLDSLKALPKSLLTCRL